VVLALICSQVLGHSFKAAYPLWWGDTTVGADLEIASCHTDACYEAMDWLYERKDAIETTLVARHLGLVSDRAATR
jgi:hypothetical protein